jgi:hypothetical protein
MIGQVNPTKQFRGLKGAKKPDSVSPTAEVLYPINEFMPVGANHPKVGVCGGAAAAMMPPIRW